MMPNFVQNVRGHIRRDNCRRVIAVISRTGPRTARTLRWDDNIIMETAVEQDANVFQCIEDAATQEVAAKLLFKEGALQANGKSSARLVIDALETLVIGFVMIELGQQAQLSS